MMGNWVKRTFQTDWNQSSQMVSPGDGGGRQGGPGTCHVSWRRGGDGGGLRHREIVILR